MIVTYATPADVRAALARGECCSLTEVKMGRQALVTRAMQAEQERATASFREGLERAARQRTLRMMGRPRRARR